jgi:hypothetical protein
VPKPFGLAINNLSNKYKKKTGKISKYPHKAAHDQARLLPLALCHLGNSRKGLSICAIARPGREKAVSSGSFSAIWPI